MPLHDFVEYWAAGQLNLQGENPYDPERVHQLEREAGRSSEGILMWNPPWTLALVMPLGLLDCRTAHLLWLALQFAVIAWCTDALWRLYGGATGRRWLAWLLAFTFLPTLFSLTAGQIAPLVLLGSVLFLVLLKQGRDALAGAATVLLAIKPHLSYLFWIALLLWSVRQRRWGVLGGGVLVGGAALAAALLCNPAVLGQYWHTFTSQPPVQYRSPTLGTVLRTTAGRGTVPPTIPGDGPRTAVVRFLLAAPRARAGTGASDCRHCCSRPYSQLPMELGRSIWYCCSCRSSRWPPLCGDRGRLPPPLTWLSMAWPRRSWPARSNTSDSFG